VTPSHLTGESYTWVDYPAFGRQKAELKQFERGAILSLDTILTALKAERDRIDRAIAALEDPAAVAQSIVKPVHTNTGRRRRRITAEARKRMSEAQKRRRAKEKKAAQNE